MRRGSTIRASPAALRRAAVRHERQSASSSVVELPASAAPGADGPGPGPGAGAQVVVYRADPERAARLAGIATRLARLRHVPNADKRVAIVLSNAILMCPTQVAPTITNSIFPKVSLSRCVISRSFRAKSECTFATAAGFTG